MPGKKSGKKSANIVPDKVEVPPEISVPEPPEPSPVPFTSCTDLDSAQEETEQEDDEEEEEEEEQVEEEEEEDDLLLSLLPTGLSELSMSVGDSGSVYSRLTLNNKGIEDIRHIDHCPNLRHIDLSHNNISDLSPLGDIIYLISLDCSFNCLTTVLGFRPGYWLQMADLSHNVITSLPDLGGFWALTTLRIDFNHIQSLEGVQQCRHLRVLTASHNELRRANGIQGLPLRSLDLSHNKIETTALLSTLCQLRFLDLSWNRIQLLRGLHGMNHLRSVSLRANPIADLAELDGLRGLPSLGSVDLSRCPVSEWPFYRMAVLYHLPQLTRLDQQPVSEQDTVAALDAFDPRPARRAAVDHAQLTALRLRRPAVLAPAPPADAAPAPWDALLLVGPAGAGKQLLLQHLLPQLPADRFCRGVSHTSRPRRPGERSGAQYVFVSPAQFARLHGEGHLLESSELFQARFGLSEAAVRAARRAGKVLVTHTDLAGALSLQRRLARVQLVLVLPLSESVHRARLEAKERTEADHLQRRWARTGAAHGPTRPLLAETLAGSVTPRQAELAPSEVGQLTRTASSDVPQTPELSARTERRRRANVAPNEDIARTREVTSLTELASLGRGAKPKHAEPTGVSEGPPQTPSSSRTPEQQVPGCPSIVVDQPLEGVSGLPTSAALSEEELSGTTGFSPASTAQKIDSKAQSSVTSINSGAESAFESVPDSTAAESDARVPAESQRSSAPSEPRSSARSASDRDAPGADTTPTTSGDREEHEEEEEEELEEEDIVVPRESDSLWSVRRSWLRFPDTDECAGLPTERLTEIPSYGSFSMMDRWARAGAVPEVLGKPPYLGVDSRALWEKSEPCLPIEALDSNKARRGDDRLRAYSASQTASILAQRQTYLSYHLQQPGLFLVAVNSDRPELAAQQLAQQLRRLLPLTGAQLLEPRWAWMERLLRRAPVVNDAAAQQLRQQLRQLESVSAGGAQWEQAASG
ncbi:uncharacterized protein LOC122371019 [Amphibalanus amphitrite]|uniref:uncharacterized protein LOC122371019 n=1 Tax=Amphibalanus amphitrite TaxID=1232801 RepID=UPI001C909594|nr:uncharacterized protein LOC122371019 [Amphibalanus amphitrite]